MTEVNYYQCEIVKYRVKGLEYRTAYLWNYQIFVYTGRYPIGYECIGYYDPDLWKPTGKFTKKQF